MKIMKIMKITILSIFFVIHSVWAESNSTQKTLKVGDIAPVMVLEKWIKGKPVREFEKGKIYIIEFWATWCKPCLRQITHLSNLQQTFKEEVVVLGIACREQDPNDIYPFVNRNKGEIFYRIALDDFSDSNSKKGEMYESWMIAAGFNSIPCTFIIGRDGCIAWIGHPDDLDRVLFGVLAGTYDPERDNNRALLKEKFGILEKELWAAISSEQPENILLAIDTMITSFPNQIEHHGIRKYSLLIEKDRISALAWASEMSEIMKKKWEPLNELSKRMLMTLNGSRYDGITVILAEQILMRSKKLIDRMPQQPDGVYAEYRARLLETMALLYSIKGDRAKAIEAQELSIEKWERIKDRMIKTKKKYRGPSFGSSFSKCLTQKKISAWKCFFSFWQEVLLWII